MNPDDEKNTFIVLPYGADDPRIKELLDFIEELFSQEPYFVSELEREIIMGMARGQ